MTTDQAYNSLKSLAGAEELAQLGGEVFLIKNVAFARLFRDKGTAMLRLPIDLAQITFERNKSCTKVVNQTGVSGWLQISLEGFKSADFQGLAGIAMSVCSLEKE